MEMIQARIRPSLVGPWEDSEILPKLMRKHGDGQRKGPSIAASMRQMKASGQAACGTLRKLPARGTAASSPQVGCSGPHKSVSEREHQALRTAFRCVERTRYTSMIVTILLPHFSRPKPYPPRYKPVIGFGGILHFPQLGWVTISCSRTSSLTGTVKTCLGETLTLALASRWISR